MKICMTCTIPKTLNEFDDYEWYPDGKQRICRNCWGTHGKYQWRPRRQTAVPPLLNRLWDNIQQCGHENVCPYCCWPWLKQCDQDGYGRLSLTFNERNSSYPVARIVFEIWNGTRLLDKECACHYCDNPPCCNPMHIWKGTPISNRLDCVLKGRQAKGLRHGSYTKPEAVPHGEQHHKAKLTIEKVRLIRTAHAAGQSANSLGLEYNVTKQNILSIIHYETWKDI